MKDVTATWKSLTIFLDCCDIHFLILNPICDFAWMLVVSVYLRIYVTATEVEYGILIEYLHGPETSMCDDTLMLSACGSSVIDVGHLNSGGGPKRKTPREDQP